MTTREFESALERLTPTLKPRWSARRRDRFTVLKRDGLTIARFYSRRMTPSECDALAATLNAAEPAL